MNEKAIRVRWRWRREHTGSKRSERAENALAWLNDGKQMDHEQLEIDNHQVHQKHMHHRSLLCCVPAAGALATVSCVSNKSNKSKQASKQEQANESKY